MRQYYNPDLSDEERSILDWENWLVLAAGQALAAAITGNMVAVVVHPGERDDAVTVEFVLFVSAWPADEQAMADFAEDLDVYLDRRVAISTVVTVDRDWRYGQQGRLIHLTRRDASPEPDSEIVLGTEGGRSVRFRARVAPTGPYPYEGSSFVVEVDASGISIVQPVFVFGFDWDALASFFEDLATSWRGWEGTKQWSSAERDLTIVAESDALGHCYLTFNVQAGPDASWRASVGGFVVGLGEEMTTLASRIRDWVAS